jgi:YVTN family beta-propeller protein
MAALVTLGSAVLAPSQPTRAEAPLGISIPAGLLPEVVAVNPVTNRIYVGVLGNGTPSTVLVIDGETNKVAAKPIVVPPRPWGIAVNPVTNRVYVVSGDSSLLTVIDGATNAVIGQPLQLGGDPMGIAVNPAINRIYVANARDNTVFMIDGETNTFVGRPIRAGPNPVAIAVNPATNRVYVASGTLDIDRGNVTVIDGVTGAVLGTPILVGQRPLDIAFNPRTNRVYVADGIGNHLTQIDVATNTVVGQGFVTNPFASRIAVNPATNRLYLSGDEGSNVTVFEASTERFIGTPIAVTASTQGIGVNPNTGRVYVITQDTNTLTVVGVPFDIAPSKQSPGTAITATWSSLFGTDEHDFVGFFEAGAPNTAPLTRSSTSPNTIGRAGPAAGSVDLAIPTALVTGQTYEVRLVSGLSGGTLAQIVLAPPATIDDTYDANSGITLTIPTGIGVLSNDTTGDPRLLRATVESKPGHGTVTLQPDGSFTYTSTAGFIGDDTFVYRATGQFGVSRTATVTLRLTATPVGVNDAYTVAENSLLTVPAPGVLANDTDLDSPTLHTELNAKPAHGLLALQPSGAFSYKPAEGFVGTDSFTYIAEDQTNFSAPAIVTITVSTPPTVAPVSDCSPRPPVQVTQSVGGGKLAAHLQMSRLNLRDSQRSNALQSIRFGALQNAKVTLITLNGQAIASGQTVTLPPGTASLDFTVERAAPGQQTTVPFTVVDGCGEWSSFVGGGPSAGF